jgi:hypothetical protein
MITTTKPRTAQHEIDRKIEFGNWDQRGGWKDVR